MEMRPKSKYIVETTDGYAIDRLVQRDGIRLHVYKSGFRTIADAKFCMEETIDEAFDRMRSKRFDEKTLRDVAESFYRDMCAKKAVSTAYEMRKKMDKHFFSRFAVNGLARKEMTPENVSSWYCWFRDLDSPRPDTKNKLLSDVRKFVDFCWMKEKIISSDDHRDMMGTIENFKVSKMPSPEKDILDEEQIKRFIDANPEGSMRYVMFSLFFYLGARRGEFLAITWDCINWKEQTIRIAKQMIVHGGFQVTNELKSSNSYRDCYLEDWVVEMLRDYKEREGNPETAYLFHSKKDPKGRMPMSFNDFLCIWNKTERDAGLPHTTPHGARHRKATELAMLCRNEEEVKASAEFLGHSPRMMMDVYVHTSSQSIKKLMERKSTCTPK